MILITKMAGHAAWCSIIIAGPGLHGGCDNGDDVEHEEEQFVNVL